ncbi:hypothetical protein [Psychroserpens damuponensis]|uniref:hypothetical protein n=1 Tax=Psychroserpens damuponensis TaxID=943936 RepID=UPI00058C99F5|nr:hypothetical protein [Psychroserpens damuponensis]
MEQSKQSEDKIIELGETLIEELNLNDRFNTLARWMAQYISELIYKIESTTSKVEKKKLKKECCNLIIQLWDKRERIPIEKPTDKLKPIISVLELFKEEKHPFIPFLFAEKQRDIKSKNWVDFLKVIKESSKRIYNKSLMSMIHDKVLEKDNQWVEKHGEFLSKEEKTIVSYLNYINSSEIKVRIIDSSKKKERDKSDAQKLEILFSELESCINEQKEALLSLKDALIDDEKQ